MQEILFLFSGYDVQSHSISLPNILSGAIVENEKIVSQAILKIEEEIENIPNVDLNGLATETFVQDAISGAIAEIPSVDLSGFATEESVNVLSGVIVENEKIVSQAILKIEEEIENIPSVDLSGFATEEYVNNAIAAIPNVDLSGLATEESVNVLSGAIVNNEKVVSKAINDTQESVNILSGIVATLPKVDINGNFDLSGYATEAFVSDAISGAIASLPQGGSEVDLSEYAKKSYVNTLSGYVQDNCIFFTDLETYVSNKKLVTSGQLAKALESITPSGYVLQSEYDEMVNTFSGLISTLIEDMKTIKENAITIA